MFFLTGNKPFHWYYFCKRRVFVCMCVSGSIGPISRMWSTEMAVVGRQWRRNSWCGHNWVTGSVCNLHTSPPLPLLSLPASVPPFCLHSVRGRGGICYGERLTALIHISLTATLPAVTIRKEHMPEPGTTSEELLHSHCFFCFFFFLRVAYSTCWRCAFEVIVTVIWTELKCGSVWLILMHLRWIPLPA